MDVRLTRRNENRCRHSHGGGGPEQSGRSCFPVFRQAQGKLFAGMTVAGGLGSLTVNCRLWTVNCLLAERVGFEPATTSSNAQPGDSIGSLLDT
jgi:hypothetical protein